MNKLTEIKESFGKHEPWWWGITKDDMKYLLSLLEEKDKALEKCFVAGNSLASVVQGDDLPDENHSWTHEQAQKYFYDRYYLDSDIAYIRYETWLAWKTIHDIAQKNTSSNNEGEI